MFNGMWTSARVVVRNKLDRMSIKYEVLVAGSCARPYLLIYNKRLEIGDRVVYRVWREMDR